MYDTPNPPFPRGESKPLPPEPLPGMLEAVEILRKVNVESFLSDARRGLTPLEMARILERESGYRDLYNAAEAFMSQSNPHRMATDIACHCPICINLRSALAKARGEKPDA